jgi:hypothetical protein
MKYFFVFLIVSAFCSCQVIKRKLYSPIQINNPSLQQKNDHSFSITYSVPSGFDFAGGYAITNRLAIIGGAYMHKNRDKEEDNSIFNNRDATATLLYRHKGFHGGLGIYLPLSKGKVATFASFFGGYIKGSFRMDEHYSETTSGTSPPASVTRESFYKSKIGRYFLQGSINFYGKGFEISLLSRYNYVVYSDVTTDYTTTDQHNFSLPPLGYPRFSQFFDLGFDSKFFFTKNRRIGLHVFSSATTRLNRKDFNFYYYPFRLGIGLVLKNLFKKNS